MRRPVGVLLAVVLVAVVVGVLVVCVSDSSRAVMVVVRSGVEEARKRVRIKTGKRNKKGKHVWIRLCWRRIFDRRRGTLVTRNSFLSAGIVFPEHAKNKGPGAPL